MKTKLYLSICYIFSVIVTCFAQQDKDNYYPLTIGSYWVYKDSFYNNEDLLAAQEGGNNPISIQKDSVIGKEISGRSTIYTVQSKILNKKSPILQKQYKVDSVGDVYTRVFRTRLKKWDDWDEAYVTKIKPMDNDTAYPDGFQDSPSLFTEIDASLFYLRPIRKGKTEKLSYAYQKGVGLIAKFTSSSVSKLTEYRIGTGTIIKDIRSLQKK